jgi:hypothetical protein
VKCTKLHPKLSSGSSIAVIEQEVLGRISDNYFPSNTKKFPKCDVQFFGNPDNPALK